MTFAQILKASGEICFEFPVFFCRINTEKKGSHRTACDSGCINGPANFRTRNFTLDKVSNRGMSFLYGWHTGCWPVERSDYLSDPDDLWPSVDWCKNQRRRGIPGGFLRLFPRRCAHFPILIMFLCLYKHGSSGFWWILSNVMWGTEAFMAQPHKLLSHFLALSMWILTPQVVSKQLFMTE